MARCHICNTILHEDMEMDPETHEIQPCSNCVDVIDDSSSFFESEDESGPLHGSLALYDYEVSVEDFD